MRQRLQWDHWPPVSTRKPNQHGWKQYHRTAQECHPADSGGKKEKLSDRVHIKILCQWFFKNNHRYDNVTPFSFFQGVGELKMAKMSDGIVPKIFSTDDINTRSGAEFGAFRPLKTKSTGGYRMSFDEEVLCKLVIPYQVHGIRTTVPKTWDHGKFCLLHAEIKIIFHFFLCTSHF